MSPLDRMVATSAAGSIGEASGIFAQAQADYAGSRSRVTVTNRDTAVSPPNSERVSRWKNNSRP